MNIFKKKPEPEERRFNLARPGEPLFQGNETDPDPIPTSTIVAITAFIPVPMVALLAVEGTKAAIRHHETVKEERRSKLWDKEACVDDH